MMDRAEGNYESVGKDEGQANPEDVEETEEESTDFQGLSVESVILMAQSVGVELTDDVASSLGVLAMERLRSATLLAMEFSEHENSPGLRVSDFHKAEEVVHSLSYGHGCPTASEKMIPVASAEVAVTVEGPKINLYKTITSERASDIVVEPLDPTLFVHFALYNNDLAQHEDLLGSNNYSCLNSSIDISDTNQTSSEKDEQSVETRTQEIENDEIDSSSQSAATQRSCSGMQDSDVILQNGMEVTEDVDEVDEDKEEEVDIDSAVRESANRLKAEGYCFKEEQEAVESSEEDDEFTENITKSNAVKPSLLNTVSSAKVSAEWQDYMKVFTNCFLSSSVDEELDMDPGDYEETIKLKALKTDNAQDFYALVSDVQQHGALPCLNVICDLLCDYLRGQLLPVTCKGLRLAVAVIDAFICCPVTLNNLQMRKLSSVLIEIVVFPAPCEILNYLTTVFMKLLKINDDLLTWTCSYITEVLKQSTTNTYESLSADLKCVFCGAISLANGLESLSIQVAQEFGWHTSIMSFLNAWSQDFQSKSLTPPEEDGFVEEETLKFCRNFLLKYQKLVSAEELKTIRDLLNDVYGEKLLILLCPVDTLLSARVKLQTSTKNTISSAQETLVGIALAKEPGSPVIRRGYWKNRKLAITYHKGMHMRKFSSSKNS